MRWVLVLVFVLTAAWVVSPGPASAGSALDDALAAAREQHAAGDVDGTAARLGEAAAAAHAAGDVTAEREIAGRLETLLRSVGGGNAGRTPGGSALNEAQRSALAAVLPALGVGESHAYVSLPCLSRTLLFAATENGDAAHADALVPLLREHGNASGTGRFAGVLLDYAEGLVARGSGDGETARGHLGAAFEAAHEEGWVELAAHTGTELAWLAWEAGDKEGAENLVKRVAGLFVGDVAPARGSAWTRALRARAPDDAKHLVALADETVAKLTPLPPDPVTSSQTSGMSKVTDLGRATRKMGAKSPLARATRKGDDVELAILFKPKTKELLLLRGAERRTDRGGLLLVTRGRTIRVEAMQLQNYDHFAGGLPDPTAGEDDPLPPAKSRSVVHAEYPLARGERWEVTKTGRVTMK